jgi:hypothetical protein
MQTLKVHFYNPVQDKDGLLNKLVARADPPYCHCEIEFSNGQSCAVYMGGLVHLKTRSFDPANYDSVTVTCSHAQHAAALALAQALAAENQAFSTRAMLASRFRTVPTPDARLYTCCSKLCAEILLAAGAFPPEISTARVTPSALHKTIASKPALVCDSIVIDFGLQNS